MDESVPSSSNSLYASSHFEFLVHVVDREQLCGHLDTRLTVSTHVKPPVLGDVLLKTTAILLPTVRSGGGFGNEDDLLRVPIA